LYLETINSLFVIPNWLQNKANLRAVVLCPYLVFRNLLSNEQMLKQVQHDSEKTYIHGDVLD